MASSELALLGGQPVLTAPLRSYATIGDDDREAVNRIMQSGVLSGYVGAWSDAFNGGPVVREFEQKFADTVRSRHAIAVNSNTSGMMAAMGAIGISPGDEVIVPPTTMSATAMAPLIYGGIPVFADLEPETFCLDIDSVRSLISDKTKAILVVNIFGHPARLAELRALADAHGLFLIEDNAQGPLAMENGKFAGTIGHIGIFSLNYHKHLHTGEGGVCTTDDARLADRLRMIRNHAENVTEELGGGDLTNLVGFNFRMTELQAAIGLSQLGKAEALVSSRQEVAEAFTTALAHLPGLTVPVVREGCRHVYYVWTAKYDEAVTGVSRETYGRALEAEGVPLSLGYVKPLYLLPIFQQRIAIGRDGWPFTLTNRQYAKGLCPVAERMYEKEFLELHVCSYEFQPDEIAAVVAAFAKVHARLDQLKSVASA